MKRMMATLMAAAVLVAGQAGATASGLQAGDRAAAPAQASNEMMGAGMGGDSGLWILFLGLLVVVAVAVNGNNINDQPTSP
jgi:hypothetical protein